MLCFVATCTFVVLFGLLMSFLFACVFFVFVFFVVVFCVAILSWFVSFWFALFCFVVLCFVFCLFCFVPFFCFAGLLVCWLSGPLVGWQPSAPGGLILPL